MVETVSELILVPTRQIKPYHRNPRKNDATVDKLVELIPRVGFNVPLVLDRQNVIVKGHTRWKAAVKLGMAEIPCVYTDADEETIKLDRLADNRVQEFSSWNDELLRGELASLNLDYAFDLGTLDFELADNRRRPPGGPPGEPAGQGREESPQPAGQATGSGAFISEEDVRNTASMPVSDYDEVMCSKCGNRMFVKKRAG
jgi:hypothetical protein